MPLSKLNMSGKTKAVLAVLTVAVFGGATSPFVKLAVNSIPPLTYTFIRFFISFLLIFPVFLITRPKFKFKNIELIFISLYSVLNIILFVIGIRLTTASTGQVIYTFEPIMVALFSYFLLKEKINLKKILGIVIGFIGINLVIALPLLNNNFSVNALVGNILIFIGCISFSYYRVISKKYLKIYSPLWLTTFFIFTASVVALIFSIGEINLIQNWLNNLSFELIWAVFYVAIVGTVFSYFLGQYATLHSSPLIASLVQYLAPGSTMIWSSFILGEKFNFLLIGGAVITLFGAWLVTRES